MAELEQIEYREVLNRLKKKIKFAQQKAMFAVNNELLTVYWEIGKTIIEQEQQAGWGGKVVEKLATDLKTEFPEMKGLSSRNLRYMRDFASAYPTFLQQAAAKTQETDNEKDVILQQAAAKLPWGHHQVLLNKLKTSEERTFYIKKAVENGWSRSILEHQIESGLFKTQGSLVNNFESTLPAYQSELTTQVFKDPYNFDFIMLGEQARERDLEDALMTHVTKVLLELGAGFAFMGRQRKFEAGGREFFIDLLFYHTKLRRHVIIELKIGEFEPEYVSKMNLYLGLADDQLKGEYDESAIGLILCKTNNKIVAEYALRDTSKPIGIAEYKIAERLPEDIKGELPSIEEIEHRVDEEIKESLGPVELRVKTIKDRIKSIKTEEIQTKASLDVLSQLYRNSLRLLYIELMEKVRIFEDDFYSIEFSWYSSDYRRFVKLELVDEFWKIEKRFKNNFDFIFEIQLNGFKKIETEPCHSLTTLILKMDIYHYSFTLINSNKQPFLKKLYSQDLQANERQQISDLIISAIMDDIERFLEKIQKDRN